MPELAIYRPLPDAGLDELARRLQRPLINDLDDSPGLLLSREHGRLQLQATGPGAPGPVWVEFVTGKAAHRRATEGFRATPLSRAIGVKATLRPDVIDATAGLGRDAWLLAGMGCRVRMIEQSPIVHALLQDGLERALTHPDTQPIAQRMRLFLGNAIELLSRLDEHQRPDVVYLDPMYPHRNKAALSKKDMQLLQTLLGPDRQGSELLAVARQTARQRVVVKRPKRAAPLVAKPAFQISSGKTRYDVYLSD